MSTRPGGSSGGGARRHGSSSSSSSSGGPAGSGSTAPGGKPRGGGRGRRFFPQRRKICAFCIDHVPMIDYKDAPKLRRYLSERARIEPRRKTGTCATHQRALAVAIKRARHLGLLPFVGTIGEHHREARPPRDFAPRGYAPRPPMQPIQPPVQPVAQNTEAHAPAAAAPAQPPAQS